MKTICVVGAGPAGLVAAKTLHQTGSFTVTVLEKSRRLGGIWAYDQTASHPREHYAGNAYLSPQTRTNLSKFTVGFSDLSWQTVGQLEGWPYVPVFPKAWQAGRYLEQYAARKLPTATIQCNTEVTSAQRKEGGGWRLKVRQHACSHPQEQDFDYLVVASGFFSAPRIPDSLRLPEACRVRGVHSSAFRSLSDVFAVGGSRNARGKKVLVIGGGNSSGEVAANIAFQLSCQQQPPDAQEKRPSHDRIQVVHVTPRPLHGMPPFVPGVCASTFMPVDLKSYDLSKRPAGSIESRGGRSHQQRIDLAHGLLGSMTGEDPHADTEKAEGVKRGAPYLAVSESFSEYVHSGDILPVSGRVTKFAAMDDTVTAVVEHNGKSEEIPDIAAVVYATGYSPATALRMLDDDVLQRLDYDGASSRLPFFLQYYQSHNSAVPDLGFVGWYEGPYWGIMEMQSRILARVWTSGLDVPVKAFEQPDVLQDLRRGMQAAEKDVPQNWFGDYPGYIEECARELGLVRHDEPFVAERDGPVSPARYLDQKDDLEEAAISRQGLYSTIQATKNGRFQARVVMRGLQGQWFSSSEDVESNNASGNGETTSEMVFYPRVPSGESVDLEFLCHAWGSGRQEPMTKQYSYSEEDDCIIIRSTGKTDFGSIITMETASPVGPNDNEAGLCNFVLKRPGGEVVGHCQFAFKGVILRWWSQAGTEGLEKRIYRRGDNERR